METSSKGQHENVLAIILSVSASLMAIILLGMLVRSCVRHTDQSTQLEDDGKQETQTELDQPDNKKEEKRSAETQEDAKEHADNETEESSKNTDVGRSRNSGDQKKRDTDSSKKDPPLNDNSAPPTDSKKDGNQDKQSSSTNEKADQSGGSNRNRADGNFEQRDSTESGDGRRSQSEHNSGQATSFNSQSARNTFRDDASRGSPSDSESLDPFLTSPSQQKRSELRLKLQEIADAPDFARSNLDSDGYAVYRFIRDCCENSCAVLLEVASSYCASSSENRAAISNAQNWLNNKHLIEDDKWWNIRTDRSLRLNAELSLAIAGSYNISSDYRELSAIQAELLKTNGSKYTRRLRYVEAATISWTIILKNLPNDRNLDITVIDAASAMRTAGTPSQMLKDNFHTYSDLLETAALSIGNSGKHKIEKTRRDRIQARASEKSTYHNIAAAVSSLATAHKIIAENM